MPRGKRVEIVKITVDGVEVDAKSCTKCGEVKALSYFSAEVRGNGGVRSKCKKCEHQYTKDWRNKYPDKRRCAEARYRENNRTRCAINQKKYREINKEKQAAATRKWVEENRDRVLESRRRWHQHNRFRSNGYKSNRRAYLLQLPCGCCFPDTMNCALTGIDQPHLDHFIPLAVGHGGHYIENLIPLKDDLNWSKSAQNPFEWFEANRQRFELSQSAFDALVAKLAQQNGLTPEEFRDFTYWCFANKRSVDEVHADNERYGYKKPSLELWREATGIQFPIAVDFGDLSIKTSKKGGRITTYLHFYTLTNGKCMSSRFQFRHSPTA